MSLHQADRHSSEAFSWMRQLMFGLGDASNPNTESVNFLLTSLREKLKTFLIDLCETQNITSVTELSLANYLRNYPMALESLMKSVRVQDAMRDSSDNPATVDEEGNAVDGPQARRHIVLRRVYSEYERERQAASKKWVKELDTTNMSRLKRLERYTRQMTAADYQKYAKARTQQGSMFRRPKMFSKWLLGLEQASGDEGLREGIVDDNEGGGNDEGSPTATASLGVRENRRGVGLQQSVGEGAASKRRRVASETKSLIVLDETEKRPVAIHIVDIDADTSQTKYSGWTPVEKEEEKKKKEKQKEKEKEKEKENEKEKEKEKENEKEKEKAKEKEMMNDAKIVSLEADKAAQEEMPLEPRKFITQKITGITAEVEVTSNAVADSEPTIEEMASGTGPKIGTVSTMETEVDTGRQEEASETEREDANAVVETVVLVQASPCPDLAVTAGEMIAEETLISEAVNLPVCRSNSLSTDVAALMQIDSSDLVSLDSPEKALTPQTSAKALEKELFGADLSDSEDDSDLPTNRRRRPPVIHSDEDSTPPQPGPDSSESIVNMVIEETPPDISLVPSPVNSPRRRLQMFDSDSEEDVGTASLKASSGRTAKAVAKPRSATRSSQRPRKEKEEKESPTRRPRPKRKRSVEPDKLRVSHSAEMMLYSIGCDFVGRVMDQVFEARAARWTRQAINDVSLFHVQVQKHELESAIAGVDLLGPLIDFHDQKEEEEEETAGTQLKDIPVNLEPEPSPIPEPNPEKQWSNKKDAMLSTLKTEAESVRRQRQGMSPASLRSGSEPEQENEDYPVADTILKAMSERLPEAGDLLTAVLQREERSVKPMVATALVNLPSASRLALCRVLKQVACDPASARGAVGKVLTKLNELQNKTARVRLVEAMVDMTAKKAEKTEEVSGGKG